MTLPLLCAIKQRYPQAQLHILLPPHLVNLFETCPDVDQIVLEPKGLLALYKILKQNRYDTAIMMRRTMTQTIAARLAGIKTLIGYDMQRFIPPFKYLRKGLFLDDAITFPPFDTDIPQVRTYLRLGEPLGITEANDSIVVHSNAIDHTAVEALVHSLKINPDQPLALFHGSSASKEKIMVAEQFAEALQVLSQAGYQIVAIGNANQTPLIKTLQNLYHVNILDASGQTTLRQSYELLKRAQLLFSVDSAPIHLAAAARTPHIIGIYKQTNPKQWRPYPYAGRFSPIVNPNGLSGTQIADGVRAALFQ